MSAPAPSTLTNITALALTAALLSNSAEKAVARKIMVELITHFTLTVSDAAARFGITPHIFNKLLRALQIKRWPCATYRPIIYLLARLHSLYLQSKNFPGISIQIQGVVVKVQALLNRVWAGDFNLTLPVALAREAEQVIRQHPTAQIPTPGPGLYPPKYPRSTPAPALPSPLVISAPSHSGLPLDDLDAFTQVAPLGAKRTPSVVALSPKKATRVVLSAKRDAKERVACKVPLAQSQSEQPLAFPRLQFRPRANAMTPMQFRQLALPIHLL